MSQKNVFKTGGLLEKYPTFLCETLVEFSEARLYEATLNLHTYVWFFSRLWTASLDGKRHLSEVVFSALVGFLLYSRVRTQGQTIAKEYYRDVLLHLRDAVRGKTPELWSTGNWRLHHFSNNENPTRALNSISLKCCFLSTVTTVTRGKKSRMRYSLK